MPGARTVIYRMVVVPAEAGIQRLKSLDPGQKHAGMTIKWDSSGGNRFIREFSPVDTVSCLRLTRMLHEGFGF